MKYIHFFFCLLLGMAVQAQIKIGDNPQNIDPSSVLELESSSRVLVITRVNTAQMDAIIPSAGALVYNTDIECIHYYTGVEWKDICDAVAGSITFTSDDGTVVITSTGGNNYDLKVGEITGMNIVNETVFGADIATATIGERQLAPNSVGSSELQDNTVGKDEIQEAAVGTLEIIDGTIKPEDMEPGAFDQLLTTDAAGNVVWLNKNELGATQADQSTITGAGTLADPIKVGNTVLGDILANATAITTKEDVANKSDDTALGNSTTLYPTQNAVKTYVDQLAGAASTLADGNIFVGSAGNVATGVPMGGDATIDNTGLVTIADLAITSPKIALNAVGQPHLADNAVISNKILNGNVTPIKIQPGAANQIMTTNTLGVVTWQPISAVGGNQDLASVLGFGTSAGNNQINNLSDPTAPQDAATRAYVDAQVGGSAQLIVSNDAGNDLSTSVNDGGAFYNDGDGDATNEIQTLSSPDNSVTITPTGPNNTDYTLTVPAATPADGSETEINPGTNITITGNGTTATPYVINAADGVVADGSETEINPGTNITITGNGTTATPYVINAAAGAVADGSETEINQGTNITITGNGTTATPYVINGTVNAPDGSETEINTSPSVVVTGNGTTATPYSLEVDGSETIIDAINSTIGVTGTGTSGNPYILTGSTGNPAAADVTFAPYLSIGATDTQTAIENLKDEVDNLSISGGGENPNNELNETFEVNGLNLELTDAGGTLQVPLAQIDTDDQNASEVTFTPAGNTTSANVQAAIEEIQTEIDGISVDGEANTTSNPGIGGVSLALPKVGVDLPFKSINAASNKVSVTDDAANNEIDIDIVDANITITESQISDLAHTVNTDNQTATDVPFSPAGNTTSANVQAAIEEIQTEIDGISVDGEANTTSNPGIGGVSLALPKVGVDLPFKSINAASNKVSVTDDAVNNEVDIDIVDANITISESQISDLAHTVNTDNQTATDVPFTPAGNTTSSNVQSAIEEIQTEIDGISVDGEANTSSNPGLGGVSLALPKVGVDLPFKSINSASNKVTVTNDAVNNEVDIDIVDANITITESQISDLAHTVNTDNQTAIQVPFTATGNTTSANVQAAIVELQADIDGISTGGEVNTASNQGTAGVPTFIQKTGVDLEFRSINAASNKVFVVNDAGNNEVDIDINDANLAITESQITDLSHTPAATAVTFTPAGNTTSANVQAAIVELQTDIDGISAGGEVNTASNQGTAGVPTFIQKTGVDLEFRSINAASNKVSVVNDAGNNEVDIDINDANLAITESQITDLSHTPEAIAVTFTPAGNTTSANVQAAIVELQTDIDGISAGGEVNTASNQGTAGVPTFIQKTGVDLEFRSINAASNKVSVVNDAGNNEVDIDINDANLAITESQITDLSHTPEAIAVTFTPAGNTTSANVQAAIVELQTDIDGISAGGEVNTASNQGTAGVPTFIQKTGVDLEFRSINAASNKVSVVNDAGNNEVDIDINDANLAITESQITDLSHTPEAIAVTFTPAGNTTSANVQAAIEEIQTEVDGIAVGGQNLANTNLVQTLGEDRTYNLNNQDLVFSGIGNIGIGNGANPPANKLHVAGAVRSEGILNSAGDANIPSYRFSDDLNTGMFWDAADQLGFSAGGQEILRLQESGGNGLEIIATGSLELQDELRDFNNNAGTAGQILSSTGTGVDWIDPPTSSGTGTISSGTLDVTGGANSAFSNVTIEIAVGAITSAQIANGTLTNDDISGNPADAIDGSKIVPDFVGQDIVTTGDITGRDITATGQIYSDNPIAPIPDFVFQNYFLGNSVLKESYDFQTLAQIEAFVKEYHHLPGIKSAEEVKQDGIWNLSQSNLQNLEKIEELFLHTIEQEKKIDLLKNENESLSAELQSLRKDMDEIKALLQNKD